MDDVLLVGGLERERDLPGDLEGVGERERPVSQPIGQRGAFDQFEHEGWRRTGVLETVDVSDVRVVERRQNVRLAAESGKALRIERESLGERLERDFAVELEVTRAVDLSHAAGPDGADDLVGPDARAGGERHAAAS